MKPCSGFGCGLSAILEYFILIAATILGLAFTVFAWVHVREEPELGTGPGVATFAVAVLFGPFYCSLFALGGALSRQIWLPVPVVSALPLAYSAFIAIQRKDRLLLSGCFVMLVAFAVEFMMPFLFPF